MDQILNTFTKLTKSGSKVKESMDLNENAQMWNNNNNYEEEGDEFLIRELEKAGDGSTNRKKQHSCSIVGVVYKHVGDVNYPTTAPASMRSNDSKREHFEKPLIRVEEELNTSDIQNMVTCVASSTAEMEIAEIKRSLLEESDNQTQIMKQVTKALSLIKPESKEEVEGHRILLLSELRRRAIFIHLPILSSINRDSKNTLFEVKLKTISLSHKTTLYEKHQETFINYYVCTATSGTRVLSSDVSKDAETIRFDKEMIFEKLLPTFAINLEIYNLRFTRLAKKEKESKWIKLKKIFKKDTECNDSGFDFIAASKFSLIGRCVLHRGNVSAKLGLFKLIDLSINSDLDSHAAIDCDIHP